MNDPCTVADMVEAIQKALDKTVGDADVNRHATMADLGGFQLALHARLRDLRFVDGHSGWRPSHD